MNTGRLVWAAMLCACSARHAPPPRPDAPARADTADPGAPPRSPRSLAELPTTDPSIAVDNFLGVYLAARGREAEQPDGPPPQGLIGLYSMHAQYFGVLDDYERALAAGERLVRSAPKSPEPYLARAGARQSLHLFKEALADLETATKLGADPADVEQGRAVIDAALGRYDEALRARLAHHQKRETMMGLAALALATADTGELRKADAMLSRAQDLFADVSPFPLAWMYFQQGLLAERNGMEASARALYQAAHERLPIYAAAAGHLAAILARKGERKRAIALLEPIASVSDDPEYWGQLGELLVEDGDGERGKSLVERARQRYEELVRKRPGAFLDHAARFWLGPGGDAHKALLLARRTLELRGGRDAFLLVIEATLAVNDGAAACEAADALLALPHPTPQVHLRASQAFRACARIPRADEELAAASAIP